MSNKKTNLSKTAYLYAQSLFSAIDSEGLKNILTDLQTLQVYSLTNFTKNIKNISTINPITENLLHLLSINKRLNLLPKIFTFVENKVAENNGKFIVRAESNKEITNNTLTLISTTVSKHFGIKNVLVIPITTNSTQDYLLITTTKGNLILNKEHKLQEIKNKILDKIII